MKTAKETQRGHSAAKVMALLLAGVMLLTGCSAARSTTAEEEAAASATVPQWESIPDKESGTKKADPADTEEPSSIQASSDETSAQTDTKEESTESENTQGETTISKAQEETEDAKEETKTVETETSDEADTGLTEAIEETGKTIASQQEETTPVPSYAVTTTAGETLTSAVESFMQENGLDSSNFSVSWISLATGETFYFNELTIMTPASTYKLPLNMYYYDMQARGEISGDDIVQGTSLTLNECHYKSLVESDNPTSEAMLADVSFSDFRQYLTRYFTLTGSEIQDTYWHRNFYCTRMMADIAVYLYNHSQDYTECIGYLKQAQPGMYFKRYITDAEVAQKYGKLNGYENCVGIVYGSAPFSLCIYSYGKSEDMVARLAEIFYNYAEGRL